MLAARKLYKLIKIAPKRKGLVENISFLFLLQILNYILPLITIPYLIEVLGAGRYGLIAFIQAIIYYLMIFSDYGFNITATKEISINRNNHNRVSEIFTSIMLIKIVLIVISAIILFFIILWVEKVRDESLMTIYGFGMVVGYAIFPTWLFQGMEKMKFVTIVNGITKIIFTILIFVFIKTQQDYIYVLLINSLGFIVSGIISLIIAFKVFKVKIKLISGKEIIHQLKEGWYLFVSTMSISVYRNSNIVILGFLASNNAVAYYSVAEKLIKVIQSLSNPISQALFPHFSLFISKDKKNAFRSFYRIALILGLSLLVLVAILSLSAKIFSHIIFDEVNVSFIYALQILSFVVFFGGMNYLLGVVGLVNLNQGKGFSIMVIISGALNILLCIILITYLGEIGAAIALMCAEGFLFLLIIIKLRKLRFAAGLDR